MYTYVYTHVQVKEPNPLRINFVSH